MPIEGWDAFMQATQELAGASGGGAGMIQAEDGSMVPPSFYSGGGAGGSPSGLSSGATSYDVPEDNNPGFDVKDPTAERLQAEGWTGDPTDSSTTLYAPGYRPSD